MYLTAGEPDTCSACTAIAQCTSASCTTGTDQTCMSCAAGFYANGQSCTACTTCAAGQYESTSCTTAHDRVCPSCTAIADCASELTCTNATDQTCGTCSPGYVAQGNACVLQDCSVDGLNYFSANVVPYLAPPQSCTQSGCHNTTTAAGGIDMTAVNVLGSDKAPLCKQLRIYNVQMKIGPNTDPSMPVGNTHPFRFTPGNCAALGLPPNCFSNFASVLDAWRSIDP